MLHLYSLKYYTRHVWGQFTQYIENVVTTRIYRSFSARNDRTHVISLIVVLTFACPEMAFYHKLLMCQVSNNRITTVKTLPPFWALVHNKHIVILMWFITMSALIIIQLWERVCERQHPNEDSKLHSLLSLLIIKTDWPRPLVTYIVKTSFYQETD